MELIYFISGVLTVGVVYGVILLRSVKSSHTRLLSSFNKLSHISSARRADMRDEIKDIKVLMVDIQASMEKDQYAAVSEINKNLENLRGQVYNIQERMEKDQYAQDQGNQQKMKLISDNVNEIQQLKVNIKTLGQDPNFVSRY